DEKPVHRVSIKPFKMGKYEVTFKQYDAYVEETGVRSPGDRGWGRGDRPVINVSWDDAQGYIDWLNRQTGKRYRLPSEAEWEYVARAGSDTRYSWGDEIGRNKANCDGCGSQWDTSKTAPVGSFASNGWGVNDLHGNVWEWVGDRYHESYEGAPSDGSARISGDSVYRVLRGGSWYSKPQSLRSARRDWGTPDSRYFDLGFRLAQDR
ncbi:MAG: formylglycine-generating enzyme family protein, partial [Gammaproteobacteria bacterium]|nr:formylglycine-generating enzyme family protein [Gammaproteobacteria bacterium]